MQTRINQLDHSNYTALARSAEKIADIKHNQVWGYRQPDGSMQFKRMTEPSHDTGSRWHELMNKKIDIQRGLNEHLFPSTSSSLLQRFAVCRVEHARNTSGALHRDKPEATYGLGHSPTLCPRTASHRLPFKGGHVDAETVMGKLAPLYYFYAVKRFRFKSNWQSTTNPGTLNVPLGVFPISPYFLCPLLSNDSNDAARFRRFHTLFSIGTFCLVYTILCYDIPS